MSPKLPKGFGPRDLERADRLNIAYILLQNARGEAVTLPALSADLAQFLPREVSYDGSSLSRMLSGKQTISYDLCIAMSALLLEEGVTVDPGWIGFGDESRAPKPKTPLLESATLLRRFGR